MLNRLRNWLLGTLAAVLALFSFQLVVLADADLSWQAPTTNTDGSNLIDLAGYNVYRRASAESGAYELIGEVGPATTSFTDNATRHGINCYVVTARNGEGIESAQSNQACKIVTWFPSAPANLTVN